MVNVDYVVDGRHLDGECGLAGVEPGQSRRIESKRELGDLLEFVRRQNFEVGIGGSALNTIGALAEMRLGLRLGFVGVEGAMPRHLDRHAGRRGRPALGLLSTCGVDCEQLHHCADEMAGVCVCEETEQGRRLRTWVGANARLADVLASDRRRRVLGYLERASIVHVSALLDTRAASSLIDLLEELKQRRPAVRLTLDPGYNWAQWPPPDFSALLRLADIVFANQQEFRKLGGSAPELPDAAVARQILDKCSPDAVLVLKTSQGATLFRGGSNPPEQQSVHGEPVAVLADVGAGDVFAAGFLAGQFDPADPSLIHSARLARRVAVEHLRHGKSEWHDRLPAVVAGVRKG